MKKDIALVLFLILLPFVGMGVVKMTNNSLYSEDGYTPKTTTPIDLFKDKADIKDFMTAKNADEVVEKYSERHHVTEEVAKDHLREKAKTFLNDDELDNVENMDDDEIIGFIKTKAKNYLKNDVEQF